MRLFTLGCLSLVGCSSLAGDAMQRDFRTRLEASEQARVDMARKLEDLDNRVFLLTDQVESQKVALAQKGGEPRLPIVTLSPRLPMAPTGIGDGAASGNPDEPPFDPPVSISDRPRRRVTLEGTATPWLADGAGSESPFTATVGRRSKRATPTSTLLAATSTASFTGGTGGFGKSSRADHAAPAADLVATAATVGDEGDPTALYRAAYARLKAGQPEQAADELRVFVQRFPRHDLADNAQYWLGETFYARGAYRDAIPEFRAVVRRWPTGNKAPDALLKLGFCHLALGESADGRQVLSEVVDHYPRTEAALLASKRLAELPTEKKN